jgi:hypothetical protein
MVHTLATWMAYQIAGVPVGAWLALAALAEMQDRLRTSKWKSNTVVQLFINGTVGRLRARYAIPADPAAPITIAVDAPTEPTRQPSDHGFIAVPAMLILGAIGLALAFMLAGCAASTDDLRRACATEQSGLAAGYKIGAAWYRARIAAAKENEDVAGARARLTTDTATYDKLFAVLDGANAAAETQCSAADAVDAGEKKDVPTMISIVVAAGVRVAEAVASIEAAFGGGGAK